MINTDSTTRTLTSHDIILLLIPLILFTIPTIATVSVTDQTIGLLVAGVLSLTVTFYGLFGDLLKQK